MVRHWGPFFSESAMEVDVQHGHQTHESCLEDADDALRQVTRCMGAGATWSGCSEGVAGCFARFFRLFSFHSPVFS